MPIDATRPPLADIDLENIRAAAEKRNFAHPLDTLRLLDEIARLKAELETKPEYVRGPEPR